MVIHHNEEYGWSSTIITICITLLLILSIVFISFILNPCVIDLKMNKVDVCLADCEPHKQFIKIKDTF